MFSSAWSSLLSPEQEGLLRNARELRTVPNVIVPQASMQRTQEQGQCQRCWGLPSLLTCTLVPFILISLLPKLLLSPEASLETSSHIPSKAALHLTYPVPLGSDPQLFSHCPFECLGPRRVRGKKDLISLLCLAGPTQPSLRH